jgi:glycosyltransferase involved in cell wall biosynthesis
MAAASGGDQPGARIRVVFVLPSFEIGGAQRVLLTLLANLDREKFAPELIVFDGDGGLAEMVPTNSPAIILNRRRLRGALLALATKLRELRPDVIFSTLGYVNLALLAMRTLIPGRPRIVIRESNLPSQSLPNLRHPKMLRLGYRYLYPSADLVICQSRCMLEELVNNFAVSADRIVQMSNPVNTEMIRASAAQPIRHPGPGARLVASGHLIPQKGFDRLLEMFANLPPDAHLTILGDGSERAALERLALDFKVADRVAMPGFSKSPWSVYAGADAMVLPSRWEGMPNAALEALACGTPVIGTPEAGGLTEVAELSRPGAVILASAGTEFTKAMQVIAPRPRPTLRASLLPRTFELARVVRQFDALLSS